jgi:DNA-binding GntR family transcriptional regulator
VPVVSAPDLSADRERLGRTSTPERVADILRDRIIDGSYRPGARLDEQLITTSLEVSRNTLRESFRLLAHERLVTHKLNRGVFVCEKTRDDVADVYRVRRLLECAAARTVTAPSEAEVPALTAADRAVADAEEAARRGAWTEVGTANVRFHQAIAALAGSRRADELMTAVSAELRLVFHTMPDVRGFHEPYLPRNREILARLRAGDGSGAERLLLDYLDDAESALLSQLRSE